MSNLDRYKTDLQSPITTGKHLHNAIQAEYDPDDFKSAATKQFGSASQAAEFIAALPPFSTTYQRWYSEALVLIKLLLPDRLADFVQHYNKPKARKALTAESYRIEDYFQGLSVRLGHTQTVVGPDAAIPHLRQQLAILEAVEARFESSLFDIRQLAMADLFDSELDAARELARKKFLRAAGAVAGVVLEKHLRQICSNHHVKITKSRPTIGDLNDLVKDANAIDVPEWRFVQHLGDIRNKCGHDRLEEPTAAQVADLIDGVDKILKTLF